MARLKSRRRRPTLGAVMKIYLGYGLAITLAGAALTFILYLAGYHSDVAKFAAAQWIGGIGGFAAAVIGLVLAIKARRAAVPAEEEFGYGSAFVAGFMTGLFAAFFGMFNYALYLGVINPEFTDVMLAAQIAKMEASGLGAAQIESAEAMMRKMFTPPIQAGFAFFGSAFFSTLIALVAAAFLKRPAAPLADDAPPLSS
jgi:hypothetical protein